jgi:hypothetical protein
MSSASSIQLRIFIFLESHGCFLSARQPGLLIMKLQVPKFLHNIMESDRYLKLHEPREWMMIIKACICIL